MPKPDAASFRTIDRPDASFKPYSRTKSVIPVAISVLWAASLALYEA
jgi:hypothetical protein